MKVTFVPPLAVHAHGSDADLFLVRSVSFGGHSRTFDDFPANFEEIWNLDVPTTSRCQNTPYLLDERSVCFDFGPVLADGVTGHILEDVDRVNLIERAVTEGQHRPLRDGEAVEALTTKEPGGIDVRSEERRV